VDRFRIADRRPAEPPLFPLDDLDPNRSGGHLCVQACADDPRVAVHAIRDLARIGTGVVSVRWSERGFGRTSSTSTAQVTPRAMVGVKDGTANLEAEDPAALDTHLWVQPDDGAAWMANGQYLVSRRIRMHVASWDRTPLGEQEQVIGRTKPVGALLGQVAGGSGARGARGACGARGALPACPPGLSDGDWWGSTLFT
jgi:deferrochelatase/peroxidase EfeB